MDWTIEKESLRRSLMTLRERGFLTENGQRELDALQEEHAAFIERVHQEDDANRADQMANAPRRGRKNGWWEDAR